MKKRMLCLLWCGALMLSLLAGCGGGSYKSAAADTDYGGSAMAEAMENGWDSTEAESSAADAGGGTLNPALQNAKIILTGNMELQSQNFDEADAFLRKVSTELGGYLEAFSVSGDVGYRFADYTVRIPQENYDAFFAQVGENCHVLSSSSQAQNITEQYVDLEARKAACQTKHDRLLALLEKADSMESIVALESALADAEYELEQLTGSLRKYDNLVNFSTVCLTLHEVRTLEPVAEGNSFVSELGQAFQNGGRGFLSFVRGLVLFAASIWPLLLVLIAAACAGVILLRRRAARKASRLTGEETDADQTTEK